jgi:hypothetical protein
MRCVFSSTFQGREYSIWDTNRGKVLPSKSAPHLLFLLPKSWFAEHKITRCISHIPTDSVPVGWSMCDATRFGTGAGGRTSQR